MPLFIPTPEPARFVGNKTINGVLLIDAGSASATSIRPNGGAQNAGFYFTGNNPAMAQGGVNCAYFDSAFLSVAGSLQIGASAPVPDVKLTRVSAGNLTIGGLTNGQLLGVKALTELTTIAAAATTDTTIQLPANALILGVSVRVTVVIPTAATFTVGDAASAARFSTAAVAVAANTTDPGTKAGAYFNATATAVRITPDLTPSANTGRVRVTIHFLDITAPTS